jgi:hypothetical protein
MAPCGHVRASLVDRRAVKIAKYSQESMVMVGHVKRVGQTSHTKNQRAIGPRRYEVGARVRSHSAALVRKT